MTRWQPIQNLPVNWKALLSKSESLHHLADVWREEKSKLASKGVLEDFLARLKRKVAIETGIIERLYSIDRGVTQLLIEKGIDHSLIPHGSTDRSPSEIVTVIRDHVQATEAIFNIVKNERSMSTSFIKQLHQLLTRNQHTVEAMDQFGQGATIWGGKDLWHMRSLLFTEPVDLLIGNSYGKYLWRDCKVPLVRIGYPIMDRHHLHRYSTIGYQGVINLLNWIVNTIFEEIDRNTNIPSKTDISYDLIR